MKILLCALAILFPVSALAATLEWDRNTEADIDRYPVYACFTAGCTVVRSTAMHQTTIKHTAAGKPTLIIDLAGKEGSIAITAKDAAGNESGLSVPVNFDKVAPSIPASPILR